MYHREILKIIVRGEVVEIICLTYPDEDTEDILRFIDDTIKKFENRGIERKNIDYIIEKYGGE